MILVIDNYDSFTWNLVHALAHARPGLRVEQDIQVRRNDELRAHDVTTLNHGRPPAGIILSPGPCTPETSGVSLDIIREFGGRVPLLGVCLGHQAIAHVHGLSVSRCGARHGKTSEVAHDGRGVFAGLPQRVRVMRYHSLAVERVPAEPDAAGDGWQVSAWCDEPTGARTIMGLRRAWKDPAMRPMEGVQFHPESYQTPDGVQMMRTFLSWVDAHERSVR